MAAVYLVNLARDHHRPLLCPACARGAHLFDNIRKCLRYLLSSNMGEVLTVCSGVACHDQCGARVQRAAKAGANYRPWCVGAQTERYRDATIEVLTIQHDAGDV